MLVCLVIRAIGAFCSFELEPLRTGIALSLVGSPAVESEVLRMAISPESKACFARGSHSFFIVSPVMSRKKMVAALEGLACPTAMNSPSLEGTHRTRSAKSRSAANCHSESNSVNHSMLALFGSPCLAISSDRVDT